MPNTLSTKAKRDKYRQSTLDYTLRNALVAEKICTVDRTDTYTIQNPYSSTPTVEITSLTGTYTPATFTVTDDALTVSDEFKVGEHIFGFENIIAKFDLFADRMDQHNYAIASEIDSYVLNNLCEDGTGTYSTPAGGFAASNIITIMSNLLSKVAGYAERYKGLFLVIEDTEVPGFVAAQATNGFSIADSALNNGFMDRYMGVDVYVVRSGTFADETVGTKSYTNSGHRVFGVKGVSTYAAPRGLQFEEKGVTGKTGMEIATYGLIGFKLWAVKTALVVDITITA